MRNKPTTGVKVVIVLLFIFALSSIPSVAKSIGQLSSVHSLLRILDILFRGFGALLSFIAIVGLWKMKRYGYFSTIIASCLEILLRLLIFVPNAKPDVTLIRYTDALGIVTFILIIYYLYLKRSKFEE